jgi:hypothetical protein
MSSENIDDPFGDPRGAYNPAQYYFLPVDVIKMLIEYIPKFMYEVCWNVRYLSGKNTKLNRWYTDYEQLLDAIMRNEVEFCRQFYEIEGINARKDNPMENNKTSSEFIYKNGVAYTIWYQAVMYGRLDILEVFKLADELHYYKTPMVHAAQLANDIFTVISDVRTLEWVMEYQRYAMTEILLYNLVIDICRCYDIPMLDYLYNTIPKEVISVEWDLITNDGTYNCIETALAIEQRLYRGNPYLLLFIKSQPDIFAWHQSHSWRYIFDWSKLDE